MISLPGHRFDEFAAETHENLPPRASAAVGAACVAALVMPWRICAAWAAAAIALETWGWFASRRQHRRLPATLGQRASFLAYIFALTAVWFALALLFWRTGTLDGAVCAAIIWISMIGFGQTFGSRSVLAFALCGVGPAMGVLAVTLFDPTYAGLRRGPIMGVMALGLGFAVSGARQTLCAARRHEETRKALVESEAEQRVLAGRAEAAAAAKADFLANMTHELRTPLNAIVGFAGVLQESAELSERDARHAKLIAEASETLLVVVNDVLDFSKLESGALELDSQPFDPFAVVRSVAMLAANQATARGLTLEVRSEGESGRLSGDGARLRQVVLNLISNALKFTSEGGVVVTVEQRAADGGRRALRIAVSDTGIGVAPSQREAIFERFNQGDASISRRFGGAGLGLAICRRIVDLMGGRMGVESAVGRGSTFWFELELPAAPDEAGTHAAADAQELDRPVRRLLVEDIDVNRELVRVMLAPFDISVETAGNGAEAIEALRRASYDIVLMDVQMPVMDGLTATRHIRALPARRRIPIIAMTANVLPEQVQRCLEAGMDGHLGKPIRPAALLETIARWTSPAEPARERAAG